MSKKKKKKEKQKEDILFKIDDSLNHKFEVMKLEIEFYQKEIDKAEKKAMKKEFKKMKKHNTFYVPWNNEVNVRQKVIRQMEGTNFFERVMNLIQELVPLARVIAELVKSLIIAILSVDSVKYRIGGNTLKRMQDVYDMANSVVGMGA